MKTFQDKIVGEIEKALKDAGLSCTINHSFSNKGWINVHVKHNGGESVVGQISFDFQTEYYILTLTVNDVKIPSQVGRDDYFDFLLKPTANLDRTRFWSLLTRYFPKKKQYKDSTKQILAEAKAFIEDKKRQGWTRKQFAEGLAKMLMSDNPNTE